MADVAVSQEYPVLNGVHPSWADISTSFDFLGGESFRDIYYKELKWTSKVEVGYVRPASGGRAMDTTTGKLTDEASAIFFKAGLQRFFDIAKSLAPQRGNQRLISLVRFNIVILHTMPGSDAIFHEEIRGCRLTGLESTMTEGVDPETVPLTLNPVANVWVQPDGTEIVLL